MRLIKILLAVILASSLSLSMAQDNNLKLGITNLAYGDYNISYERPIQENQTMNFRVGYFQPFSSFIMNFDLLSNEFTMQDMTGGFQTSLEYRFYLNGENNMTGFYIAPYMRYAQTGAQFTDKIKDLDFEVTAKLNIFGIGGQLGYQWEIQNFSLDLYFMGLGVDRNRLKMEHINVDDPDGYSYNGIKPDVKDPFGDENLTYFEDRVKFDEDVTGSLVTRVPFIFPGVRMGFSVGYRF